MLELSILIQNVNWKSIISRLRAHGILSDQRERGEWKRIHSTVRGYTMSATVIPTFVCPPEKLRLLGKNIRENRSTGVSIEPS